MFMYQTPFYFEQRRKFLEIFEERLKNDGLTKSVFFDRRGWEYYCNFFESISNCCSHPLEINSC